MILRLEKLTIKDFAGIKLEEFNFNGADAYIYGKNASGKTTVANALNWLLFGKNIEGKTAENLVPLDDEGNERKELTPIVEAVFTIDDSKKTFRKESHPVTKTNQYGQKEYKNSRKTNQYIDEVPYKVTDFNKEIESLIDENIFKLITNTNEFSNWNWKKKRELLFDIRGGAVSNEEVISSNENLKDLILPDKSIEEETLLLNSQLKRYKEDLKNIPIKVDTLYKQLPEQTDFDYKKEIEKVENEINVLTDKRHSILNGGNIIEYKNRLAEKQNELNHLKRTHDQENDLKVRKLENEVDFLKSNILNLESKLKSETSNLEKLNNDISNQRNEWKELYNQREKKEVEAFKWESDTVCSCCGQELPRENIEELKEKALENFNINKSNQLEKLDSEMEAAAKKGKELSEYIEDYKKRIEKAKSNLTDAQKELETKETRLKEQKEVVTSVEDTEEYISLAKKIEALESDITHYQDNVQKEVAEVDVQIKQIKENVSELRNKEAELAAAKKIEVEIDHLTQKENEYRNAIEMLSKQLYLLNEFIVTKVNLTTEKINEMFELVEFKMFETQVNGELKETCEITVDGVSYDKGLNTASKINASLDIIETISKHYDTFAPIFIDNAESVTHIFDTTSQQIGLVVNDQYNKLNMELV